MPRSPPLGEKMMKELMSQILGNESRPSYQAGSDDEEGGNNGNMEAIRTRREPIMYTRDHLLRLSQSPHVQAPASMPRFDEWYGEFREVTSPAARHGFPQHFNANANPQDRNRTKRAGKNGPEGQDIEGEAGDGKYGRASAMSSGRPRNAPFRALTGTTSTDPISALLGSTEPEPKDKRWEKTKGNVLEGGDEGDGFAMGRFGLAKGKLGLDDVNGRGTRARQQKGEGRERTEEARPELGAPSRSGGASDWRRGALPSRPEPSGPSSRWKEANGHGSSGQYQQNDEDKVPEWMMDDPAVQTVSAKSRNAEPAVEQGQADGKKKKLRGLEDLQAQNDEIAAYRQAMKDKEKRRRGETVQEAQPLQSLPPLEDPAIAAQIAAPPEASTSYLLPPAKSRATTLPAADTVPVAGGRGSRFAKFFDAPAISQDPARSSAPSQAQAEPHRATAHDLQLPEKTQGLAALLGIKASTSPIPRQDNSSQSQASPMPRQHASPSPMASGLLLNGMQSGQKAEGQSGEHMNRLLGMLKGPTDKMPSPPPGLSNGHTHHPVANQHSGLSQPSGGPSNHVFERPQGSFSLQQHPQTQTQSRDPPARSAGLSQASPGRNSSLRAGQIQGFLSGPPQPGVMQGQNLLAQLQGGMPLQYGGGPVNSHQEGYAEPPPFSEQQRNSQQQMLAQMSVDAHAQPRSPLGPPQGPQTGPQLNLMHGLHRSPEPAPHPLIQKQLSFWQLANQLQPSPGQQAPPHAPPQQPHNPGYMPQYGYGGPMPPGPMPYMHQQPGMQPYGQQRLPPGMMPPINGMGQQYIPSRPPPLPPHHMNPDLMALLGGMQARPQA